MSKIFLRHNLVWGILILLLLPGLFALMVSIGGSKTILKWMTHDYRLKGFIKEIKTPTLDLAHFKSHDVQKYVEEKLTIQLPLRSFLIRLNNQIYYSLFKRSHSNLAKIVVGKSNQLFEMVYINSYCGFVDTAFSDPVKLIDWANKIKILSDFFEKQGKTFVYVITPSKAEYVPEAIPTRFHCKIQGTAPHVKTIERLLTERKIRYVNGSDLMFALTEKHGVPMFPKGGSHWNMLAASEEANALIATINGSGHVRLNPIQFDYQLQHDALGDDRELMGLLNVLKPNYHYIVPEITFKKIKSPSPLKAAFVGGSFLEKIVNILAENQILSKISFYRYFMEKQTDYVAGQKPIKYPVDLNSPKSLAAILAADVIVFEENSELTVSFHGKLFFEAMKKFVPIF